MRMEIKELGHIVLYVHNIERSAAFYGDVLGWKQLVAAEDGPLGNVPVALFSSGRTHHELLLIEVGEDAEDLPRGRHVGLYHFGLKVGDSDDELRAAIRRCQEAGVHHRRRERPHRHATACTSSIPTATRSSCTSTSPA